MLLIDVQQNSPQWAAHRATHFNASQAAAMLGVCPYKTRDQLLHEKKTGIIPAVDRYTQKRFDQGHQFEEWARTLTENALGEELFPCVGVLEGTKLSASFDGLTMDRRIVWEHKSLNKTLRQIMPSGDALPLHYRVQLEQQLMVSGASKAVLMASTWNESGELMEQYQREYVPDKELRQQIIHGWLQFEKDLAGYTVKTPPIPKAKTDDLPALPPLHVQSSGQLTFSTNLAHFKQHAFSVLNAIHRDLVEESDFAHAENVIKWCKTSEDHLTRTLTGLIETTPNLNELFSTIKTIQNQMRDIRLDLDKQVNAEKARIKNELITAAIDQVNAHYATAGVDYPKSDVLFHKLVSAIKGLKNLDKMQNAIDRVVIEEKTVFNQQLQSGELTRLISLEDINRAIAPLMILDISPWAINPVSGDGANALYKAADFITLTQRLSRHLLATTLAKPFAKTA